MKLSPGQEVAHDVILDRLRRGERLTKLAGYAGTGKTTLGEVFLQRHGDDFSFRGSCPTGKAAARQQELTGMPSSTIHRLFWKGAKGVTKEGDLEFGEVDIDHMVSQIDELQGQRRRVLWIDEGSMVDLKLARKIMKAVPSDFSIIVSGDPFQHKPVNGVPGFDLEHPDAMLTEVHRQALGSPVIRLATWVRTEKKSPGQLDFERCGIPYFTAPFSAICESVAARKGDDAAVVTHTHMARRMLNYGVRHYMGLPPRDAGPAVGETLLIRRNCSNLELFNGSMVKVTECTLCTEDRLRGEYFLVRFEGVSGVAWLPKKAWIKDEKLSFDDSKAVFEDLKTLGIHVALSLIEASPGYAGTCHAFQGSQFKRVFLLNEGKSDMHWWYTGITRAEETLVCGKIKGWSKIRRQAYNKPVNAEDYLPG